MRTELSRQHFRQSIERIKRMEEEDKKPRPKLTGREQVQSLYERKVNPELSPATMICKSVKDVLREMLK